ncbi:hypothetical protein D0868_14369 [Hortaea werneckii]|uniref:tetrahydrofolate synthase n=1 Tax=Hortaea werneckii TaxID=91943 RepID=A0A3M6XJ00_HORWE|nr:hypothetical protein D0868_14369 [Hortaea werneckii]
MYSTAKYARDYNGAVQALNSLQSNFSIVEAIRKQGPGWNKLAIPEMVSWVRRIGYEPSDFDVLNPVHIAGTKGKGSTSAFVSSILAQYLPTKRSIHAERLPSSVGLYTSPHLRFVRERIKINNQPISEPLFAECFWEVWDKLEANPSAPGEQDPRNIGGKPVYFHYLTLMALHCYMQAKVGTAVIECGIGGEHDTTNILCKPSVTGVTSLGIDHQALLGDTIDSIAWHKAGIFKEDTPAYSVPQPDVALEVLHTRAKERGTELHVIPEHPALQSIALGLQGDFQRTNASLAIAVSASHLSRLGYSGVPHPLDQTSRLPEEFITGLEAARLGGRCDLRQDVKHPGLKWYIDGGHTLESIDMAGRWFASIGSRDAKRILIFNQQTRDASALARRLHQTLATATGDAKPFQHAIFCTNTTYANAGYKADLVSINTSKDDVDSLRVQRELAQNYDSIDPEACVHVLGSVEEAVQRARELSGNEAADVLVTGSLHLVGGVIEVLENESEVSETVLASSKIKVFAMASSNNRALVRQVQQTGRWHCIGGVACPDFLGPDHAAWAIDPTDEEENQEYYCTDCIAFIFEQAASAEGMWQPRIGRSELDIEDFAVELNRSHPGLVLRFREHAESQVIPVDERVYCRHPGDVDSDGVRQFCNGLVGRRDRLGSTRTWHTCSVQEEEVLPAYDQGYRWQRCPGCGTSTEHITGCNHMTCTFCDEQYCRICGEAHRDDPLGNGRHWNYPNPCPRHNYPVPRNPDDGDPNWPNSGHRFWALDLAGLMFRRQDIEYDDAQSRQVATEYPDSRSSRDQSLDMFQPLDEQDTPYRACARHVANIHHLYRGGHLARRMRSIYYMEDYQPRAYQVNDEMLPLLAALRHVTTYCHNLAVDFENGRAFPMEEARVIHRILFTHQVHMLRRKFRRFARYTNDIDTGHWLALRSSPEWRQILRSVLQLRLPPQPDESNPFRHRESRNWNFRNELRQLLREHFEVAAAETTMGSMNGRSGSQAFAIHALNQISWILDRDGFLTLPESFCLRYYLDTARQTLENLPAAEIEQLQRRTHEHQVVWDVVRYVTSAATVVEDLVDEGDDSDWQLRWDERLHWVRDLLSSIADERVRLSEQDGHTGEEALSRQLAELYQLLRSIEQSLSLIAANPGAWAGVNSDPTRHGRDQNIPLLLQLQEFYRGRDEARALQPVFHHASKLLYAMLASIGLAHSGSVTPESGSEPSASPSRESEFYSDELSEAGNETHAHRASVDSQDMEDDPAQRNDIQRVAAVLRRVHAGLEAVNTRTYFDTMAQVVLHEPTEMWRRANGRETWRDLYILFNELSQTIGIRDILPPAQNGVTRWMYRRALWRGYRRYYALFRRWEHRHVLRELFPRIGVLLENLIAPGVRPEHGDSLRPWERRQEGIYELMLEIEGFDESLVPWR